MLLKSYKHALAVPGNPGNSLQIASMFPVMGYALSQSSRKVPPQAGCSPAARRPWPKILGNHFSSVKFLS
jgi:hypothetical protein